MKPETTLSWMLRISLALTVGVVLLNPTTLFHAQVDTGSILGTVTDPSGALIGNATVTLTNEGTGFHSFRPSVGAGRRIQIHAGPDRKLHQLSASLRDSRPLRQKNITVNVGSAVVGEFSH